MIPPTFTHWKKPDKMMRYILVLLFSCLFSNLMAQQPLQVSVMLMPPYPNYVDEMINMGDEAIITVQNTDFQNGYEFKLGLSIDGNNGVSMHTRADALPLQPIDIGPGETLIMSGTELSVIYNNYSENDIEYSGITIEQIINDQSLPDGVYNICVRAY